MSDERDYLLLLAPSANRVYAGQAERLAAAELQVSAPFICEVDPVKIAGVDYLGWTSPPLSEGQLALISGQSARLALFEHTGGLLAPVELPQVDWLDDDLVTIPKYSGKTNEQFTRLLLNVTLAQLSDVNPSAQRGDSVEEQTLAVQTGLNILDPLCGRGTTLTTGWLMGHNGFGVDGDAKAVEALASYLASWLRRKRLKHTTRMSPVRRDGKSLGKRFDAEVRLPAHPATSTDESPDLAASSATRASDRTLTMGVFTGDTRDSAALWGKKRFDAVVADAPYGVVHGSSSDVRGHAGKRDRSPAGLLGEAVPVWAGQLRPGGALGLSWNTYGLTREDLGAIMERAGLEVVDTPSFAHRVDSSINRDLMIATQPR